MKELTQKQIDYTVKNMIIIAQSQIEDCGELKDAVNTLEEVVKLLDGDFEIARSHWAFSYYCTPIDVFNETELEILVELGIHACDTLTVSCDGKKVTIEKENKNHEQKV